MEGYIVAICCYVLAAIFDSERDTIQYKPRMAWSQGKWWLGSNYLIRELLMRSDEQWWKIPAYYLLKYPFSFVINGWHLCKSTTIMLLMLPFSIYCSWIGLVFNSHRKLYLVRYSIQCFL